LTVIDKSNKMQLVRAVWVWHPEAEHCDTCADRNGFTTTLNVPVDWDIPIEIGLS